MITDTSMSDSERLDWLERVLFDKHWDGTLGRPCTWHMVGSYRYIVRAMRGPTLRDAIDAAAKEIP